MMRRLVLILVMTVLAVGTVPTVIDLVSTDVAAQSRNARPNFLQRLFGIRPAPEKRKIFRRATPKTTRAAPAAPPVKTAEIQPKDPDARKILVVGDFVAGGIAWGLEQTFAEEPKIVVIDRSVADSGLVRADRHDWNAALLETLNDVQPDLIVLEVGANDRQEMRSGDARHAVRSDVWLATYTRRITGIVDTLKVYGRPFFWVGAPPMRNASSSSDMAYLNGLYKPRVQTGGGVFVDIWNGFSNKDGRYVASGPDVEGQVRQLRTRDGINFTRAGRLKLAFYVEREIRRQTGFGSGGIDLLATVTQGNQIEIAPDGTKILVGPVISLSDPVPGLSRDLAGATAASPPGTDSLQFKMIVRGEVLPDVAGRVDDFAWPPREARDLVSVSVPVPMPVSDAMATPVPVARPESLAN
jgi:hypothetical protein